MQKPLSFFLALALCLGLAVPASAAGPATFTDVPARHWAYAYIQRTFDDGIITGTASGTPLTVQSLTLATPPI